MHFISDGTGYAMTAGCCSKAGEAEHNQLLTWAAADPALFDSFLMGHTRFWRIVREPCAYSFLSLIVLIQLCTEKPYDNQYTMIRQWLGNGYVNIMLFNESVGCSVTLD